MGRYAEADHSHCHRRQQLEFRIGIEPGCKQARQANVLPDPSGKLMHAEVRIGDTVVMVADGAEGWPPVQSHVHVYVKDVDSVVKRAEAAV